MTDEDKILAALRDDGPASPRSMEKYPPEGMSATAVRIAIQSLLDRGVISLNKDLLLAIEKLYYIQTNANTTSDPLGEHIALWWAPDRRGYTTDLNRAGLYSKAEAAFIVKVRPGEDLAFEESVVNAAAIRCLTVDKVRGLAVSLPRKGES